MNEKVTKKPILKKPQNSTINLNPTLKEHINMVGLIDAMLTENTVEKFEKLFRLGLADRNTLAQYKRVLIDPKSAMTNSNLRKYLLKLIDRMGVLITSDDAVYQQIVSRMRSKKYTFKECATAQSLYQKSINSNIPYETLVEVYLRGVESYDEKTTSLQCEQFAFNRVNSFIAGGKARLMDEEVWDKPYKGKHSKLSSSQKAKAKARAAKAGRPYPNMVDNIWAANEETKNPSIEINPKSPEVRKPKDEDNSDQKLKRRVSPESMTEASKKDPHEYDYEGEMAMSQLKSIIVNSKNLIDMMKPDANLPEWVQSKITLAEDYILTCKNYMQSQGLDKKSVTEMTSPVGTTGKRSQIKTVMQSIRMANGNIEKHPPGKSGSSGGGAGG